MTEEQPRPKCDIDDILCQMEVLSHLRGMKNAFGDEKFQQKFPEFVGWDEKIVETIARQEIDLKAALEKCSPSEPQSLEVEEKYIPKDIGKLPSDEQEEGRRGISEQANS